MRAKRVGRYPCSLFITLLVGALNVASNDTVADALDGHSIRASPGRTLNDVDFDARADLNHDGVVNVLDIASRRKGVGDRGTTGAGPVAEEIIVEPLVSIARPGESLSVMFLIRNNSTPLLGYSLDVGIVPGAGAMGTVTANVAMTNLYPIQNLITGGPAPCAALDPFFSVIIDPGDGGVFVNAITDDNSTCLAADGVNDVLAQVFFDVSPDASGEFTVQLGPASALSDGDAFPVAFSTVPGTINAGGCITIGDCGDVDSDGVTDDVCSWFECIAPPSGPCNSITKAVPSDMGGAFGACAIDGFCNIHDANHALACFSGLNTCDGLNIDAGGAFGACEPDGFCNIHDANHALACFSGLNTCSCPPVPTPDGGPIAIGSVSLQVVPDLLSARPGDEVVVRVFLGDPIPERGWRVKLQSYQLHLGVSGGKSGRLELVDISTENRTDWVFAGLDSFEAYNVASSQMLAGLYHDAVVTEAKAYLATFTYRVSVDAAGTFVVDVLHSEASLDQTFLIASFVDPIAVAGTSPAVIIVGGRDP